MPKIRKGDLDDAGKAVERTARALESIDKTLAGLGGRIDEEIKSGDANAQFDFGADGPESQKIRARLRGLEAQIQAQAEALRQFRNSVESLYGLLGERPPWAEEATAIPPAGGDDSKGNFVEFLTSVGDAVLKTQRQLDAKSRAYIGEAAKSEFAVPSAFRIPKLSGKMMFELEFEKKKGVNLIFNTRSEAATRRNQQSIEFDIVSVPAPVGAAEALRQVAGLELVFDPEMRAALFLLNSVADKNDALPAEAVADPHRVLLLRRTLGNEEVPGYLIVYAGQSAKPSAVGMWVLRANKLEVIYRFQRQNGDFEDRLKEFACQLADAQKELLEPAVG